MKKIIINDNQRGFLFKNGRYVKTLSAGKYHVVGGRDIVVSNLDKPIEPQKCTLETLMNDHALEGLISYVDVADQQYVLHYVNDGFCDLLTQGKYAFWQINDKHTYEVVDIRTPEIDDLVPEYILSRISPSYYTKIEVNDYQKARLFFNKRFIRLLEPGTYYFWKNGVKIDVNYIDTRLTKLDVTGQSLLTQDKVTLRVSFVCNYRIKKKKKILSEIDDFVEQLHVAVQLAMRDYVGKYKLDDILANKEQMSDYIFDRLKQKEKELYVEITDAGVKDIVLPGEIRSIMNTVLIAEKKAQANVITRREEVASTRSLLNTAKLLDENKTLYKLKELEYIERICANVGSINIGGGSNILAQLSELVRGSGKSKDEEIDFLEDEFDLDEDFE